MGNKNKQTKGIWIPEEIKVDKKLDWTNKALLSEIYSLCELPDGCIASDNHFGKFHQYHAWSQTTYSNHQWELLKIKDYLRQDDRFHKMCERLYQKRHPHA
jgi:hypothetical protein